MRVLSDSVFIKVREHGIGEMLNKITPVEQVLKRLIITRSVRSEC